MAKFQDLGLAEPILRALAQQGYGTPTPIQSKVIPAMISGKDILGIAQTGTGKTAAFALPLLQQIAINRRAVPGGRCRFLILVPTRELASQVADNIRSYANFTRLSVALVIGGVRPGPQAAALSRGPEIVVATPGRLEDHMAAGAVSLSDTETLVLDEADQMLDLGFMPAVRRIIGKLPERRQTVLLSATMPKQIRSLARDILRNPTEISVAPQSRPIERIDQQVMHVDRSQKREVLTTYLKQPEVARAIVFTRTKRGADRVHKHLQNAGLATASIHGNHSQNQRQRALDGFRSGRIEILVATDVAARGIDVDDISHVVNFELPNVAEAYVHRIGRTARAGKAGVALALCDNEERGLLRDIEKLIGRRLDVAGASPSPTEVRITAPGRQGGQPPQRTTEREKNNRPNRHRRRPRNGNKGPELRASA